MRPPAPRSWGRAGNAECEEELQWGGPREESSGRDGRSVTGDDATAAAMFEQVDNLSSGGNPEAVKAMERALGVKWEKLDKDERLKSFVKYVQSLKEGEVDQTLAEKGFPVRGNFSLLATPAAKEAFKEEIKKQDIEPVIKDYQASTYTKERQQQVGREIKGIDTDFSLANWRLRLDRAQKDFDTLDERGNRKKDKLSVSDKWEPLYNALEDMQAEALGLAHEFGGESEIGQQAHYLISELVVGQRQTKLPIGGMFGGFVADKAPEYEQRLEKIKEQARQQRFLKRQAQQRKAFTPEEDLQIVQDMFNPASFTPQKEQPQVIIHNHNETIFRPSVGEEEFQRFNNGKT